MNILRIIYYIILTHQWACFICLVHIGKFLKWTGLACFSFFYLSLACLFWLDTLISIFYRECTSCNYILEEVNFAFFINPMCTSTPDLFVLQSFVIIYIIPSFTLALLSMTWQPVINLVHMQVNFRGTRFFHERDVRDSTLPTKYRNRRFLSYPYFSSKQNWDDRLLLQIQQSKRTVWTKTTERHWMKRVTWQSA